MALWRTAERHVVLWTHMLRVYSSYVPSISRAFRYTLCRAFPNAPPCALLLNFPLWLLPCLFSSVTPCDFPLTFPVYLLSVPMPFFVRYSVRSLANREIKLGSSCIPRAFWCGAFCLPLPCTFRHTQPVRSFMVSQWVPSDLSLAFASKSRTMNCLPLSATMIG